MIRPVDLPLETFPIVPAQARALVLLVSFIVFVMVGALALVFISTHGSRRSRFEVSEEGLRIRGDVHGRLIPASEIRGADVRVLNLTATPELTPVVRNFGTSIAGYLVGWFRLRNGETALAYLTDRSRVVYVPTTAGYSVLLSAQSPERLAARLAALPSITRQRR